MSPALFPAIARLSPSLQGKWQNLLDNLIKKEQVCVALSGGVDSGLLAAAAQQALGKNVLAVTINSPVHLPAEINLAKTLAEEVGLELHILLWNDLDNRNFTQNPPDRCYYCKLARFKALQKFASELGEYYLIEGSNKDDEEDYRPGRRAVKELGLGSPLAEAELSKTEIRTLAKALNLPVWDRPSEPCLATRFAYGEEINLQKIKNIAEAEEYLKNLGFSNVRVRSSAGEARIEVLDTQIEKLVHFRSKIIKKLKSLDFIYISADLSGYRSGSLNEVL